MHFTAAMITDLRSARAIIKYLKQQDPNLTKIAVPLKIYTKIREEFSKELTRQALITDPQATPPNFAWFSIYGVTVQSKR